MLKTQRFFTARFAVHTPRTRARWARGWARLLAHPLAGCVGPKARGYCGGSPSSIHTDSSPEAASIELEQQAELLAAVNTLRPEDRLVIAYRYWLELPEAEMAEALGVARGTVKSRLSRALGRLRLSLETGHAAGREGSGDA